jgi:hypothetical protein
LFLQQTVSEADHFSDRKQTRPSRNMTQDLSSSTTSLMDVFPWSSDPCTILVGDSVQSDGRFVLHSLASQVLGSSNGRLLWLSGAPLSPTLVATALKKIGCDAATIYLRDKQSGKSPLCIRSIPCELGDQVADSMGEDGSDETFCMQIVEAFTKQLYREVKAWVTLQQSQHSPSWVILDDVSAMAALLGSRLTYSLILSLRAHSSEHPFGLVIRCSQDQALVTGPPTNDWRCLLLGNRPWSNCRIGLWMLCPWQVATLAKRTDDFYF